MDISCALILCHVYEDVWKASIREKCIGKRESNHLMDKNAIQVMKGNKTVGQLPCEFSPIAWYFLMHGREISVEVIG